MTTKFWATLTAIFFTIALLIMGLSPTPHYAMIAAGVGLCFAGMTMASYEDYLQRPYRW